MSLDNWVAPTIALSSAEDAAGLGLDLGFGLAAGRDLRAGLFLLVADADALAPATGATTVATPGEDRD
jgi:hypothetical protein